MNGSTLDDLKAELAGLQKARRSGALTVVYKANGTERSITYRRDSELQAAIAALQAEIDALELRGAPRNIVVRGRRGWAPERDVRGSYGREHAENWRGHPFRGRNEIA